MRFVEAELCESLIRDVNDFIDTAYTEANVIARRAHVYEHAVKMEAFAFVVHSPGSPQTDHLPGFRPDELPEALADLCQKAAIALRLDSGRMLFNVGRYPANCEFVPPHYDGELFDYTVEPGVRNHVRSGIRPSEVALLTLRNETQGVGTDLYDENGKTLSPRAEVGELLVFDNTCFQHSVPNSGEFASPPRPEAPPRWIRYIIGWRALEEGYAWSDGTPLRPLRLEEAIELHEDHLANQWSEQLAEDLARGTFPFPKRFV